MNPPSSPARCSGLHSFLGPCLALRLRVPEPFSLSLSLCFALPRGKSCKQSLQPARRSCNPIQQSISLSLSLLCFALGLWERAVPFPRSCEQPRPPFLSLSLALFALLRGNSCKQASSPSSPRGVRATPSNILYIYIYMYLSLSLFQSLSLSLSLLCSGVTAASSPSSPRGVRATPSNILYIYIYISLSLSVSLSFFLSAGLRGARPTTPCVYGVAGFGAPSD